MPYLYFRSILSSAGILLDESSLEDNDDFLEEVLDETTEGESIEVQSIEDLEQQLAEAIENEDYELASKIRDEIKKRKA